MLSELERKTTRKAPTATTAATKVEMMSATTTAEKGLEYKVGVDIWNNQDNVDKFQQLTFGGQPDYSKYKLELAIPVMITWW